MNHDSVRAPLCNWCQRELRDFSRRVHPVGAHDAWKLAAKDHAEGCWWITSRAGHLSCTPQPQPEPDRRRTASVALLRAMDREPRSYLMDRLRAYHAGADRDELGDLLREAFGPSTSRQVTKDGFT
jgi:hypothetical protein